MPALANTLGRLVSRATWLLAVVPLALASGCAEEGSIDGFAQGPELRLDEDAPTITRRVTACPEGVFLGAINSADLDIEVEVVLEGGETSTFHLHAELSNNGSRDDQATVRSGAAAEAGVEFTAYPGLGLGEICSDGITASFERAGASTMKVNWAVFATFAGDSSDLSGASVELSILEN
jgi:hypothetical protein